MSNGRAGRFIPARRRPTNQRQCSSQRDNGDNLRLREPKSYDLIRTGESQQKSLYAIEREVDEEQQAVGPIPFAELPEQREDAEIDDDLIYGHRSVVHTQLR